MIHDSCYEFFFIVFVGNTLIYLLRLIYNVNFYKRYRIHDVISTVINAYFFLIILTTISFENVTLLWEDVSIEN